ncbi:MAG: transcriptional regulator [Rhodospirillaceae bacterium]|nr:transcriptional regulator [Rhodospirillaceae bacterium]MBT7953719.1 transcriptional regulator [Rhodospirillaceae bacterium]
MDDIDNNKVSKEDLLGMASDIVSAYVSQNEIAKDDLPDLITTVYNSLSEVQSGGTGGLISDQKPAISVRRSITPDFIVCLEDGKKLKMLKRYLRTNYKMTPEEYRAKWNLPHDYPMVAPNYAKQRSEFAKNIGLGRSSKKK